jgi:hypothetical protein
MKLLTKEHKRVGIVIAIVATCVIISWTSVYFLGDDNVVEEEMDTIEINILENQFHFTEEEAEKDISLISPRHHSKEHN